MKKTALPILFFVALFPPSILSQGGWSFNNPLPTGFSLYDIERDNAGTLWVVGEYGQLMSSVDDGLTWRTRPSNVNSSLKDILFAGTKGWIVGNGGTVLSTVNGGSSWNRIQLTPSRNLVKIQFYDSMHGWILAADSVLFFTTDGGDSWDSHRFDTSLPLNDFQFVSPLRGWLTAGFYRPPNIGLEDAGGMLMKTTDGGFSWGIVDSGKICFRTISFIDSLNGWFGVRTVPFTNGVLRTTDGGLTRIPISPESELQRMHFLTPLTGWALQYQFLKKSTDGGMNWLAVDQHEPEYSFNGLYMQNIENGWSVSSSGFIRKTTNAGATWTSLDKRLDMYWASLHDVVFCNPLEGWVVGHQYRSPDPDTSIVLHTNNGGSTWERQSLPSAKSPYAVFAIDNLHIWTVAESLAFYTTNGGATWLKANVADQDWIFRDIYFRNTQWGILVGSKALYKTTNAGVSWEIQAGFSGIQFLRTIDFADSLHGWIVGHPGTGTEITFQTTDGGISWNRSFLSFTTLDFVDELHGWAIGTDRTVNRTNDGGRTWFITSSQVSSNWTSTIVAADTITAWIWDSFGAYRTSDGGYSWSPEPGLGFSLGWIDHGLDVVNRNLAWLVGRDGRIYTYRDDVTTVQFTSQVQPSRFLLKHNYPNPFNPSTSIDFSLPVRTNASLQVFDMLGRQITTLLSGEIGPGEFSISWNAQAYSSGIYFYRLQTSQFVETKRMVLMK